MAGRTTTAIVTGDPLTGRRVADIHEEMAAFWYEAAQELDAALAFLNSWTGEAADAARFKIDKLRQLMTSHSTLLRQAAGSHRKLAAIDDNQNEKISAELAKQPKPASLSDLTALNAGGGLPLWSISAGVASQAVGTLLMAWCSFGLSVRASIAIMDGVDSAVILHINDAARDALAGVTLLGGFAATSYVPGVFSAMFFEGAANGYASVVQDAGTDWRIERVASLAAAFTAGETAGFITNLALLGAGVSDDKRALLSGVMGGFIGGLAGPTSIKVFLGESVDLKIWGESVALGLATGTILTFLNRLRTAEQVIASVRARL